MAFRVGVVGHRPDRLPPESLEPVRGHIADILASVAVAVRRCAQGGSANYYAPGRPTLIANSPLAEGADRMFAEEALAQGYQLTCVMPFAEAEFTRDFSASEAFELDSPARFSGILARAEASGGLTRFELDGRRDRAHEAYEAAGRVVIDQSDLMIAIWDGGSANGTGGTFQTLRQALAYQTPTVWIDTRSPFSVRLLEDVVEFDDLVREGLAPICGTADPGELDRAIDRLVAGELNLSGEESSRLESYLNEIRPRRNFSFSWKLFRDFMDSGTVRWPGFGVPEFVGQIRTAWPTIDDGAIAEPPVASWINARLRSHYAWSDKLADFYADAHRSGFINASLLAAAAVFTALLPVAAHFGRRASVATAILETIILILMVGLPLRARQRAWHRKWLEYRVMAELVRELRILAPLGGARPAPRTAAHLASYGDPTRSWMNWQIRAIARGLRLPNAKVDAAYVSARCAELLAFLGSADSPHGQIGFHHRNCERMETIHQRLHRMSLILFAVTIAAVAANWMFRFVDPSAPERLTAWLVLFSAFLPALGAAFASINNQGEFARLQRRSRAMADGLASVRDRIATLAEADHASLAAVLGLAGQVAAMMMDENTDWRIVVLDLPHAAG
jgi:hypothetical protein